MALPRPTSESHMRLLYWAALLAIFGFATWQRFSLPLDPIADPDTWGYLSPALRKLAGAEFGHTGRNFIYPGFLLLMLRASDDVRAITVAQHFLGLLAAGVLLLTWRRACVFLPNPRIGGAARSGLGLIAAALFLFAGDQIHFELKIRPEGVSAFLISVNLWLAIQVVASGLIEKRTTAATAYGSALVFSSILLASVKPTFVLAGILTVLPLAVFFLHGGRAGEKFALAGAAMITVALLVLPERLLSRNDENSRTFLPTTLFAMHANLIRDQMADDLQRGAPIPYPSEWLQHVQSALSSEIAKSAAASRQYHVSLGFSPDYLIYHPTSIAAQLRNEFGGNITALCAFYRFYYWRIWQHRPLLVLRKIAHQLSLFYAPMCPAYNWAQILPVGDEYERSVKSLDIPLYRKIARSHPAEVDILDRIGNLPRSQGGIEQGVYIRKPLGLLAATYLPMLFISLGFSIFVLLRKTHRGRFGWLAALVLFMYSYNFAICFEVAVVSLLEYRRYIVVQMYATTLAQFFALWFIVEFAIKMRGDGESIGNRAAGA